MKLHRVKIIIAAAIVFISLGFNNPGELNDSRRQHLFIVERNRDKDIIQYDVNLDEAGNPDLSDPINIYWVRSSLKRQYEPLTSIQKRLSYGIRVLDLQPEGDRLVTFRFVSNSDRIFSLVRSGDRFRVLMTSGSREIIVGKIYVEMNGGSDWIPKVSRVELHGTETETGIPVTEVLSL